MSLEKILRMVNITKQFGNVQALKGVDFDVGENEVVGLLGDNGAGKSTLVKIIAGFHPPTTGEFYFAGEKVRFLSPQNARKVGIEAVYQESALVDLMSISRNFFLGREPTKFGYLDEKRMDEECVKAVTTIGVRVRSPREKVSVLSGGERQSICIGRALYFQAKLLLFDEPTAALSVKESEYVLKRIKSLKEKGVSAVVVAHNIYHVYSIADRFVILDRGIMIGEFLREDVTVEDIMQVIRTGSAEALEKRKSD